MSGAYVSDANPVTLGEYARQWAGTRPHRPTTATRVASLISKHIDATKICSMRGSLPCDPHRCKPGSATEPKFSSRGSFTPDGKRRVPPNHQDHEGRCRCRTWSPRPRQHTSPSFSRRKMARCSPRPPACCTGRSTTVRGRRPGSPEGWPTGWHDEPCPATPLRVAAAGRRRVGSGGSGAAGSRERDLCSRHAGISCGTVRIGRVAQSMPRGPLTASDHD